MNENLENSHIELPLVVADSKWHEVYVYLTVEQASESLNPAYLTKDRYRVFDANSNLMLMKVITEKKPILGGIFKTTVSNVVFHKIKKEPKQKDELRNLLINYINRHDTSYGEIQNWSLNRLIREAARLPKQERRFR